MFKWLYRNADPKTANVIIGAFVVLCGGLGLLGGFAGLLIGVAVGLAVGVGVVKFFSRLTIS